MEARVTLFDLYPVLLLLGVLGLALLWVIRGRVATRVAARRRATTAISLLAMLLLVSVPVRLLAPGPRPPAPGPAIPSSQLLNWQLAAGLLASNDTSAVTIEVEHPGCAPIEAGSWLADPIIAYTPWSVTITMHMNLPDCTSQQAPHEGSLPIVGGYLMGILYEVPLSEPLGNRALYDGSSSPPAERSPR